MRGTIAGLVSPAPLTETLPAMLRTDHFAQQLCASFDEVLAPVILSLDALNERLRPLYGLRFLEPCCPTNMP